MPLRKRWETLASPPLECSAQILIPSSLRHAHPHTSRLVFKENATQVLDRYPPIEGDQRPQMWTMGTDYVFSCPDRYTAIALARTVRPVRQTIARSAGVLAHRVTAAHTIQNPTYVYVFDQPWSFDGWGPYYDFCVPYSCHGADMPFVFGTSTFRVAQGRMKKPRA